MRSDFSPPRSSRRARRQPWVRCVLIRRPAADPGCR
jgi:hypothetical protein